MMYPILQEKKRDRFVDVFHYLNTAEVKKERNFLVATYGAHTCKQTYHCGK